MHTALYLLMSIFVNVPVEIDKDFNSSKEPPPWKGPESKHTFNFLTFSVSSVLGVLVKP